MIGATSPIFAAFFARIFIKESLVFADFCNFFFVLIGIVLIVKPPFIFGESELYSEDPQVVYAVIAMICTASLLESNVFVMLRVLKSKCFKQF